MLKRFSISLIIISSIVYLSIFLIARHQGTGFFDEILIQLNRLNINLSHEHKVKQSKFVLKFIHENKTPPAQWNSIIIQNWKMDSNELFYYYKVWMIKTGLTLSDIEKSYPIFVSIEDQITRINMRYGPAKPVVQFPFSSKKKGQLITGLFFPINEPPFSADLNGDKVINQKDVELASGRL